MNVNFEQLVKRAINGSQEAMADLYTATSQQVYFTVLKLVGNPDDAQDLASDTYLTAFQNLHRLSEPRAFAKWVRVIAVNHAKDFLKKKKPILFAEDEEEERALGSIPEESEDCLPEVFVQREDLRRQVVELIDSLPEAQKAAVYLHYMEGRSVEEVAEIMEVNENTIKSRLNYARNKLRKLAEKSGLTLGAISVITLILREECKATSVPAELTNSVTGIIGSVAGAAGAAAAANAGAGTAAAAVKTGIAAKAASMGIGAKIAAFVAAGAILIGGGVAVSRYAGGEEERPSDTTVTETQKDNKYDGFIDTVEDHGGLDSFLGMTRAEIEEILGDEFRWELDATLLGYIVDGPIQFWFGGSEDDDAVCLEMFSSSEELAPLDVIGYKYEKTVKFLEKKGYIWTDEEPMDNGTTVEPPESGFVIYAYDGDVRYTIISDDSGHAVSVGAQNTRLYDEYFNYEHIEPDYGEPDEGEVQEPDTGDTQEPDDAEGPAAAAIPIDHLLCADREEVTEYLGSDYDLNSGTYTYDGLIIMQYYGGPDHFYVTGSKYSVCGVRVGDTEAEARAKLSGYDITEGEGYIQISPPDQNLSTDGVNSANFLAVSFENGYVSQLSYAFEFLNGDEGTGTPDEGTADDTPAPEPEPEAPKTNEEVRDMLLEYWNSHCLAGAAGYYFADLTGDGFDELLNVNADAMAESAFFQVFGIYNGEVLEYGFFENGPMTGAMIGYYLYEENGKTYILEDNAFMRQGYGQIYYTIYSFTNAGERVELRGDSYEGNMLDSEGEENSQRISAEMKRLEDVSLGIWYYDGIDLKSDIR